MLRKEIPQFEEKLRKYFVEIYLAIMFLCISIRYLYYIYSQPDPWRTGEWLINAEEGVTRRFLIGQVIYLISGATSVNVEFITAVIQLATLGLYFYAFKLFLSDINFSKRVKLVLLTSPFLVTFQFNSIFGGLRKEIIGLILVYFLASANRTKIGRFNKFLIIILLYMILIFSWEAGLLFLPFLIIKIWEDYENETWQRTGLLSILTISSILCIRLVSNKLTPTEVDSMCTNLLNFGARNGVCDSGAFDSLLWKFSDITSALHKIWEISSLTNLTFTFLVCCLIFVGLVFGGKNRLFTLFSLLPVLPLFVLGLDYGRWISILASLVVVNVLGNFESLTKPIVNINNKVFFLILGINLFFGIPHISGGGNFFTNSIAYNMYLGLTSAFEMFS